MNFILVYITNPTRKEAQKISRHLLKERLIACANIFESQSFYWWKEKIKESKEFILIVKTIQSRFEKIKKEVEKIHSYSIPCIIKIPVSSNKKFSIWLNRIITS